MKNENIIFISLSKIEKDKIEDKFKSDVEDFMEKELNNLKRLHI